MGESSPREATDSPTTFVERFQHFKEDFGVKHPISTSLSHPFLCVLSHEEEPQQTLELNIFDFDGTLFRSPEPNFTKWSAEAVGKLKGHPTTGGLGWFQEVITLSTPYVPLEPGDEWWNHQLVNRVRDSMASRSSITVLLTGRTESYRNVIQALLDHLGLAFDEIGLKDPPHEKTMVFKKAFIDKLVEKYKPQKINMWEDRPNHLEEFSKFLLEKKQKLNIDFEVHFVELPPHFLSEEKEREVIEYLINKHGQEHIIKDIVEYTGVLLDKESHFKLLQTFPPKERWSKKAHHMTICMGEIREELFASVSKELCAIGREVDLEVVAYGEDQKAAAVMVQSGIPTLNSIPHVTIAVSPIGRARDSHNIKVWRPVRVTGEACPVTTELGEESQKEASLEPIWLEKKLVLRGKIFQNVRLHIGTKSKPQIPKVSFNFGKIIGKHHPDIKAGSTLLF